MPPAGGRLQVMEALDPSVRPTAGHSFRVIADCSEVSPARLHPASSKDPGLDSPACSEARSLPACPKSCWAGVS